jgi:sec-independent protein translocase protein TatC
MPRPTENDLFAEEQAMPAMSFGEHIEDLRRHLILALLGLVVGVLITFIPPASLGARVLRMIQEPAQAALNTFYKDQALRRAKAAEAKRELTEPFHVQVEAAELAKAVQRLFPTLQPDPAALAAKAVVPLELTFRRSEQILNIATNVENRQALVSLAPMETFSMFFLVCLVTGLVISSPWVFYQIWQFIAAGLYRHERYYVKKFLPFSLGLFLAGVFLCFFAVLPVTLDFLLQFNVWLGIEPTLRITEWVGFATVLPLIFGICFQTPLVMLIIERLGIVTAGDFRAKRKYAIMIMVVAAAIITPTQDPFSLSLLAVPMILLYELGLVLIGSRAAARPEPVAAEG